MKSDALYGENKNVWYYFMSEQLKVAKIKHVKEEKERLQKLDKKKVDLIEKLILKMMEDSNFDIPIKISKQIEAKFE